MTELEVINAEGRGPDSRGETEEGYDAIFYEVELSGEQATLWYAFDMNGRLVQGAYLMPMGIWSRVYAELIQRYGPSRRWPENELWPDVWHAPNNWIQAWPFNDRLMRLKYNVYRDVDLEQMRQTSELPL